MKSYQDVVSKRFDAEQDTGTFIYSPTQPIGKYIRKRLFNGLDAFLKEYTNNPIERHSKKLLDLGCGSGEMLNFFVNRGFAAQNAVGMDLSENRINKAKEKSKDITFIHDNVLTFNLQGQKFDLITAFDLFSHLNTKEQIIQGLANVHKHLQDDGLFLWYDIYAKDHFAAEENAESWGFNKVQMVSFAQDVGFDMVYSKLYFKNFFNRYHSAYQVKRVPPSIVRVLESVLPGMPGNIMIVFKKI